MSVPFPRASIELDYPLYALDFDPEDAQRLVVGGGGGAGRSGVGNKITVLDVASQNELRVAADVELSRDEDSVMSLAVGPRKGKTTYVFAGVNSGPDDIAKGKNENLRTLAIEQSKARGSAGVKTPEAKVQELSRVAAFANPDADTYQRLLRVCGPVGAAATAMGKDPQIAVFDAVPSAGGVPKPRGVVELPRDAEDLDIVQTGDGQFQLAFCHKYELRLLDIGKEETEPRLVFTMPDDHGERPVFRSIRYLSPEFILAVSNLPKRSGVLIQGFRLPSPGHENARIAVTTRIPRKISATAMAVANLAPSETPGGPLRDTQFIVAVAGNDSSISIYTLEHQLSTALNLLHDLYPLYTLKDVHGADNITGVAFSRFVTPKAHIRQQFIKLASISLQKSVAVHSIPLKKFVDRQPRNAKAPPRPARYVTAMKARQPSHRSLIITLTCMVLLMAIVYQSVMEMYGRSRPILSAQQWLPSWHGTLRSPDHQPPVFFENHIISKLAGGKTLLEGETMVLYETQAPNGEAEATLTADVHDHEVHGPAKKWEDLSAPQKLAWRQRLREAGAWTQGMGESVFKGILFGQIAGAIGDAVGN
ncbi:guanine nucleotide exchange factor-like protein [Purpureocillium lilacinum]|nr:guanine nucleotide exchange factor-like protein [Purpureocillium lilacinum]OAQ89406.1 guanine nucleotide exchange factor-like protein [Purpureocillium lilacinum]